MAAATITKSPTERYRERLQGMLDQRAELQLEFDRITADGEEDDPLYQSIKDLDEDIGRTRFTLQASERADAAAGTKSRADALARRRKNAERALTAYEDASLTAEKLLGQFMEQWERVEKAYADLAAATPDPDSLKMGGQTHKPLYVWRLLMLPLRQRIRHEIPKPMSTSRPLESLAGLFGRKRNSLLSWVGLKE